MYFSCFQRILLVGSVCAAAAFAQDEDPFFTPPRPQLPKENRALAKRPPLDTPRLHFDQKTLAGMQAVETALDPNTYRVGPGDVFAINFWGPAFPEPLLAVPVTPEGMLIIPAVGSLPVAQKTLAQVQETVSHACAEKFNAGMIRVTAHLSQVRMVRIHIYGEIENPGGYLASAAERVSACLQRAGELTEWADASQIEIRAAGGSVRVLDLTRLQQEGDVAQDPYVQGGEVIFVPRLPLTHDVVFVEGAMPRPGPYRLLPNESILDFLYRVKALTRQTDFKEIFLLRHQQAPVRLSFLGESNGSARKLAMEPAASPENDNGVVAMALENLTAAQTLRLQPGDRVVVSELREYVYVHGAVRNPGSYPFIAGYKIADYVGLAGGTVETASLKSVKVVHRENSKSEKGADKPVARGDAIIIPNSTRKNISDYLTYFTQAATITLAVIAAVNAVQAQ